MIDLPGTYGDGAATWLTIRRSIMPGTTESSDALENLPEQAVGQGIWELFRRRITVLLAARRAVLFFGGFVQLEVAARSPNTPARLFPRTLALARPMHVVGGMGDGQLNQART